MVICQRVAEGSIRESRNGGYIHVLIERERKEWRPWRPPIARPTGQTIAPIERRHAAYTAILESLRLSERHADDLLRRGLHDTFIGYNLFASTPAKSEAKAVCADLVKRLDLTGVPGCYRDGRVRLNVGEWSAGYFVPVRDLAGRIQGMHIRRDDGSPRYVWFSSNGKTEGATSGTPIHFAAPHRLERGSVIVTEGALKADIIAQFAESAVIGLAGVGSFKAGLGAALKSLGVTKARIAFDADWRSNPAVSAAIERLGATLNSAGLAVSLLDWTLTDGKGLDDLLTKEVV